MAKDSSVSGRGEVTFHDVQVGNADRCRIDTKDWSARDSRLSVCGHIPDPKDRNASGNRREISEWRVAVDTDVWTRLGGEFQIPAQDRRSLVDRHILQKHGFTRPAPEHSPALGRPNIANPVQPLAEHCHEVSLTVPVGDHHGQHEETAAAPSHHLECGGASRSDSSAKRHRRHTIQGPYQHTWVPSLGCPAQVRVIPLHHAPFPRRPSAASGSPWAVTRRPRSPTQRCPTLV